MNHLKKVPGGENLHGTTHGNGGSEPPNPLVQLDPGLFFWTILTFVTLSFVLSKFAWKPLLAALKEREDEINKSLDDATKAKSELEKINIQSEEIISKAKTDAQVIHSESKAMAEKVRSEMIEKAHEEVKTLKDKAEKEINMEKDRVLNDIKKEVVDLSIVVAEKLIKKNMSEDDNEKLINETLRGLKGYEA